MDFCNATRFLSYHNTIASASFDASAGTVTLNFSQPVKHPLESDQVDITDASPPTYDGSFIATKFTPTSMTIDFGPDDPGTYQGGATLKTLAYPNRTMPLADMQSVGSVESDSPFNSKYVSASAMVRKLTQVAEDNGWPMDRGYVYNLFLGYHFAGAPQGQPKWVPEQACPGGAKPNNKACLGSLSRLGCAFHGFAKVSETRSGTSPGGRPYSYYNGKHLIFTVNPWGATSCGDPANHAPNEGPPPTGSSSWRQGMPHDTLFDDALDSFAHETFEALTDPNVSYNNGWVQESDPTQEIADDCSGLTYPEVTIHGYDRPDPIANHDWGDSNNPGGTHLFEIQGMANDLGFVRGDTTNNLGVECFSRLYGSGTRGNSNW